MSGFTAEEALEFQGTEDAEMIDWGHVGRICEEHGADLAEFVKDQIGGGMPGLVDAGDLLAWLGY